MDGGKSLTICDGRGKSDFWAVLTAAALGRTAGPASALEPVTEFDPRKEYADLSEPLREQSILLSFIHFSTQHLTLSFLTSLNCKETNERSFKPDIN